MAKQLSQRQELNSELISRRSDYQEQALIHDQDYGLSREPLLEELSTEHDLHLFRQSQGLLAYNLVWKRNLFFFFVDGGIIK